ncbi:APC family permease [Pelagibius sp.]|uniref:APC family permease n=1 Tax=Pelagibius sp. TaxID=1931238 RepID=UPI003BB12663
MSIRAAQEILLQQETHLQHGVIGFPTALATAIGLIIAGPVLLTATTGFGIGGGVFAAAIVIAYLLMLAQLTSFSEAAAMIPTAGSVYDYIGCGLGRFWSITGTLAAYLIVHVFAGTAEVAVAGAFATVNFGFLSGLAESGSWVIGVALVLLFGFVNILGIEVYGKAEIFMTAFMWGTLMIFGIVGVLMPPAVEIEGFFGASLVGSDFATILSLVGLAMFLFVGCEFVTPLAAELKNAARNIPRSMYIGTSMVAVSMFIYGAAIKRQVGEVPVEEGATVMLLETPLAIPVFAGQVLGTFGQLWLGIAVLLASAATINTLLAGVPRILYGMAVDGALPKAFAYLHPRFKTPIVGIVVTVAIPAVYAIVIDGNVDSILKLILAAVCAWLFAYILVNLSIIQLRRRRPDLDRPYRVPFYAFPQIMATLGMLVAIWFIAPPGIERAEVYIPFGILLALTAGYALFWLSAVKKTKPFQPVEPEELDEFREIKGLS